MNNMETLIKDLRRKGLSSGASLGQHSGLNDLAADAIEELIRKYPTVAERDKVIEDLWAEFADVPMDPDSEKMEDDFLHFPHGTNREEIWHWFDQRHSKGVHYLLYGFDGVDRTTDVAQLVYRNSLCTECMSESCAFNPNGICMVPFLTGAAPRIHDDGCNDFVYYEERS